jgi:hypothetical protein
VISHALETVRPTPPMSADAPRDVAIAMRALWVIMC